MTSLRAISLNHCRRQRRNPERAQVHIHQELHGVVRVVWINASAFPGVISYIPTSGALIGNVAGPTQVPEADDRVSGRLLDARYYGRGVLMIESSDFRTTRRPLSHGAGHMPVLGF